MTTIAYKNHTFAYDSQSTQGNFKSESSEKVFVNDHIVFAVAGRSRVNNILKYMKLPPLPDEEDWSLEKWVNGALVTTMRKEIRDSGFEGDKDGIQSSNQFFIYTHNRCFYMNGDFYFKDVTDKFYAIGSGSAFSIGAMSYGASPEEAVKIAKKHDIQTGGKVKTVKVGNRKKKK